MVRFKHRFVPGTVFLVLGLGAWWAAQGQPPTAGRSVTVLGLAGEIGPATSDYVQKGLRYAAEQNASLVVIEMNTPGGLDTSMREIIGAILDAPVPVATFVWPGGSRAASAGTYILYASHIAAMAPATNLGAATPVAIGGSSPIPLPATEPESGDEEDGDGDADSGEPEPSAAPGSASELKAVNDAVAYIRSLAEHRGRNAEWAEQAVRSAASLSAQAALANNVIDLIEPDLAALLAALEGRTVTVRGGEVTLELAGAAIDRFEPDWRNRFLAVLSKPTVAYILLLLGIYGLVFEGYNPGAVLPGVVGALSLLLALFAFQILPVNYAGLALILLGVVLMIAEFMVPSFGALGFGGVAAFVLGSLILIDTDAPGFQVALPLIGGIAATAALALLGTIWLALRARERPIVSGAEELTHLTATAIDDFERDGNVRVRGERWQARSASPVRKGQPLKIMKVDGLLLHVEPAREEK